MNSPTQWENWFQKEVKYENRESTMNPEFIDLFEVKQDRLSGDIYIVGIKEDVHELVKKMGGVVKAAKKININYSTLKDWPNGKSPISIKNLNKLLEQVDAVFANGIKDKINQKDFCLKAKISKRSIRFPKFLTTELAYIIGVILGDGDISNDKSNAHGSWRINVTFANLEHLMIYSKYIENLFRVKTKYFKEKDSNCYACYFTSKAVHWYLRNFFELPNGAKHSIIEIPKKILDSSNEIRASFLRGLYDTDGTFVAKKSTQVSYSSTSEKIVNQVINQLDIFEINCRKTSWLKDLKYKMLYSVVIRRQDSIKKFQQIISFQHPLKKQKLENYISSISPVV